MVRKDYYAKIRRFHSAVGKPIRKPILDTRSFFMGICSKCGHNVVVVRTNYVYPPHNNDYWYCSNKSCKKHRKSKQLTWVTAKPKPRRYHL